LISGVSKNQPSASVSLTVGVLCFFTGFLLFKDFCLNEIDEAVPQLKFYEEVSVCAWD